MKAQRVDVGKGVSWLGDGWRIFTVDPGMWIVLTLISAVATVIPSLLPPVGPLLFALIMPGLLGGLLYAASEAAAGRGLDPGQLVAAFKQVERRNSMLVLGALSVVVNLVMSVIALVLMGGSLGLGGLLGGGDQQMLMTGIGMGLLLALLIDSLISLLWIMALFYAVPLVMFTGARPAAALKSSIEACTVNAMPLLVIGVLWLLLALLAALPLMLGYLVLVPVSIGAIYASYRDIFSATATIAAE